MSVKEFPSFDDLPLDKSGPPGNAWGLWGNELGMLNLLTPEVVAQAATEIKEGLRISLDWPLNKPSFPTFGRQQFEHEILNKAPMTMNDDAIAINTQSSTQWDGFRHYGYQGAKQFYKGHKQEEFGNTSGPLGIESFSNNGGIIGRGVLVDWYTWAQENGVKRSPFETNAVFLSEIKAIIADKGIQTRHGDILFVRVGFTAQYNALPLEAQQSFPNRQPGGLLGMEATQDSMRWLWENRFAAIASDAMGFERGPATGPHNNPDLSIHQWALAGWGMPLGELFDLEVLAQKCAERGRWTFFLCSVPLKIPGGVASPGNAVAIL